MTLSAGAANLGDILVGHDTWDSYSQMTKIYKRYDFALSLPGVKGGSMAFSSYPGELFSDDDLYMMGGSQLTVTSTTLHLLDDKIFQRPGA